MGPLQVGATVSQKYKVVRLLAESGGVVLYEATDTARAQRVWIKILQREALNDPDAMERFQREAGGAKVLDVGKNDAGLPYMVATEFNSGKDKPPLPARKKTTLPGVAPPPPPLPRDEEEEPPPSSGIPLSADDVEIVSDRSPEPFLSPLAAAPAALSPLITTPPAPLEREEVAEPEATVPLPTIPLKPVSAPPKRPASQTPTVFIERPREKSTTGMWIGAMAVVASISGIVGYSMAQKNEPHVIVPEPTATTSAAATATETTPIATTAPIVTAATPATDTVTPAPTATATATATATVTATAVAVAPTVTATPATATPAQTATHAPVVHPPATHKPPPQSTHASSGDPLTL